MDVTLVLLKEELVKDAKDSKAFTSFDPYRGNSIEGIFCPDGPTKEEISARLRNWGTRQ